MKLQLVCWPLPLAACSAPLLAQEPAPSARELLERHVAWRCAEPSAPKVTAIVGSGRVRAGGLAGTVHRIATADGRSREDVVIGHETTAAGIDAQGAWRQNPSGQVRTLAPTERDVLAADLGRCWFGRWPADAFLRASARGIETIDGVTGQVVVVPLAGTAPLELVLGSGGELLAQRTHRFGIETVTRCGDWRGVAGLRLPFREESTGGVDDRLVEWTAIETVRAVDEAALRRPDQQRLGTLPDGQQRATLPLRASATGHWFLTVTIAGTEFQALLDTGAGGTILDDGTAQRLGIAASGEFRSFGAGSKGMAIHQGEAATIELAGARLRVHTLVADLDELGKALAHEVDLVVGHELTMAFAVQFDQQAKELTLWDAAKFTPPAGAIALPAYASTGGQVVVPATVESLPPTWFVVDTGAPPALLLNSPYVQAHDLLAGRRLGDLRLGGVDGAVPAKTGRLESFTFAGATHERCSAIFSCAERGAMAGAEYAGIIGNGILRQYTIIFDLLHERLWLLPPAPRQDK